MILGGGALTFADRDFFLDQLSGYLDVARHEHAQRELKVLDYSAVKLLQFGRRRFPKS